MHIYQGVKPFIHVEHGLVDTGEEGEGWVNRESSTDIHTTPYKLRFPGGSDGQESATQETPVRSLGGEDPLEKGMATHSSILPWRIPWTEEPGRLQCMGSQRVGHN